MHLTEITTPIPWVNNIVYTEIMVMLCVTKWRHLATTCTINLIIPMFQKRCPEKQNMDFGFSCVMQFMVVTCDLQRCWRDHYISVRLNALELNIREFMWNTGKMSRVIILENICPSITLKQHTSLTAWINVFTMENYFGRGLLDGHITFLRYQDVFTD